jgi:hypothetical protein
LQTVDTKEHISRTVPDERAYFYAN